MTRRPAFCSAFLEKPEGLRQCKMKPLRDSNLCRHHDPRFCTAATRRKMDHATAVREYMKAQVVEGRRQEREAERDARRWGSQEVTVAMSEQEKYTIKNNKVDFTPFIDPVKKVGEAAAQETRAWLEERQRNTSQANKEVLCRPSFVKQLDAVVTNFRVRKETRTEDPRDRQYDYGAITAIHEGKYQCVLISRCNLCRLYEYPRETEMLPHVWCIPCNQCGVQAHRHCIRTTPRYYFDSSWTCIHCMRVT
ncbi:hypothetical protein PoB_005777400 [Plakobranchus ocellatus]|uniref:PHD finger protein 10 n=1 Tax=Plakobranchus ocellatus TaxID=259542 RepID=A0AAV4CJF6_9GAST|nr:hypothetical protein PoB_005777400 [Plakobranchus ocellatus]